MSSDLTGPAFIAPETQNVKRIVIFLHGYGANGNDLISLSQPMAAQLPDTAFYSPDAPFPCEANPMGRQWFSLSAYDPELLRRGRRPWGLCSGRCMKGPSMRRRWCTASLTG